MLYKNDAFEGLIGVARADITPPVGIYARNWGAAKHDIADGIDCPLRAVVMTLQTAPEEKPLILVSLDLGWWKAAEDEFYIRGAIIDAWNLPEERVIMGLTHTHSSPAIARDDADKPGGHLIAPYLHQVRAAVLDAVERAIATKVRSTLTWDYGHCTLARNRDLPDPQSDRIVCGFNPTAPADDSLLVGRVCDEAGKVLLTIANYACHPTSLAWQNHLISPDWVGAFYQTVEDATGGLAMFLQGASGELQPARTYTADLEIIRAQGRQLGYATLSVLEGMLPPRQCLEYDGVVESGAPLACWKTVEAHSCKTLAARSVEMELPLQADLPSLQDLQRQWENCQDRVLAERLTRKMRVRRNVGDGVTAKVLLTVWQIGDCLLIASPNEAYSLLQTTLRQHVSPRAVAVLNLANGAASGYLPPAELYEKDIYQVWQTPFAAGSLEIMIEKCIQATSIV